MEQDLDEGPAPVEQPQFVMNRRDRRLQARAVRQAAKQSEEMLRLCRSLDTLGAIEFMARRNKGRRVDQFEALVALHRTRLTLPGITEQESAQSLAWLTEQNFGERLKS